MSRPSCCECDNSADWLVEFKDFEKDGGIDVFAEFFCNRCLEENPLDVEISRTPVRDIDASADKSSKR